VCGQLLVVSNTSKRVHIHNSTTGEHVMSLIVSSADKVVDAVWTPLNNSIACIMSGRVLILSLSGIFIDSMSHPTCLRPQMHLFTSLTD
jgi:hypothetical protein